MTGFVFGTGTGVITLYTLESTVIEAEADIFIPVSSMFTNISTSPANISPIDY